VNLMIRIQVIRHEKISIRRRVIVVHVSINRVLARCVSELELELELTCKQPHHVISIYIIQAHLDEQGRIQIINLIFSSYSQCFR
jgi:hypothetical protein